MLIALVGCSQETVEITTTTKPSTTVVTTTTTTEVVITTTTQPQTTLAETTSRTKQTTKPTTTKPKSTTEKVTTRKSTTTAVTERTTQKQITTKKVTTTSSDCKGKNDHWMPCGNVGKWYSSKQAFMNEYNSKVDYWNDKLDNDEISYEEYIKQVPRGYEIWQCAECGKWTGNYKYKQ